MPKSAPKRNATKRGKQGKHAPRVPGNKAVKRPARAKAQPVASPVIPGTSGPIERPEPALDQPLDISDPQVPK